MCASCRNAYNYRLGHRTPKHALQLSCILSEHEADPTSLYSRAQLLLVIGMQALSNNGYLLPTEQMADEHTTESSLEDVHCRLSMYKVLLLAAGVTIKRVIRVIRSVRVGCKASGMMEMHPSVQPSSMRIDSQLTPPVSKSAASPVSAKALCMKAAQNGLVVPAIRTPGDFCCRQARCWPATWILVKAHVTLLKQRSHICLLQ